MRVRGWVGVRVGNGIVVGAGLADRGEGEGGVLESLALGLWGWVGEEVTEEEGGEEDEVREDLGP